MTPRRSTSLVLATSLGLAALAGCSGGSTATSSSSATSSAGTATPSAQASPSGATNVYAGTAAGRFSPATASAKQLVYVPNQQGHSVDVVDPHTYKVIRTLQVGLSPEHVVPSWDLKTLWVNSDTGNSMTPIDPTTGKAGRTIPIDDPYNLYFTPDGASALVMAERLQRIDIRDAHTMKLQRSLPVPCHGLNHADYTADLGVFLASCEFDGKLLVIDKGFTKVRQVIELSKQPTTSAATSPEMARRMGPPMSSLRPGASSMPQDVRLTPDGTRFQVADMLRNGIWVIDAKTFAVTRFLPLGKGTHGIYPSRDQKVVYVSNRGDGTISVLDASTLAVRATWHIPGGGSPDMGQVSPDGRQLWLSGRYNHETYVFDTATGAVVKRIRSTEAGPHGLTWWPQPGSFSLGHTGNMR